MQDESKQPPSETKTPAPPPKSIRDHLLYTVSLPERALRTTIGTASGLVRESAALLVPQAFQDSKTYGVFVGQMLNFLTEDVGRVAHPKDDNPAEPVMEDFVARKTVGNFVEMAGIATIHLSPVMLLAIVSDVAYGSQTYLKELSQELKKESLIAEDSTIDSASDLLRAIQNSSSLATNAFNTPPISVQGLKEMIAETRAAVGVIDPTKILPKSEIDRMWSEMTTLAKKENVGLLEISSAMTLHAMDKISSFMRGAISSARVVGRLFDRQVVKHYQNALSDIQQQGYYPTLAKTSGPYIDAVWNNFSTTQSSITEDLLSGKTIGIAKKKLSHWLGLDHVAVEKKAEEEG